MTRNLSYHELELNLISNLKTMQDIAISLQMEKAVEDIKEVLEDVKTHRFSIAVVGEFRRGKSTFVNALLGRKILPSDVLPTTATISRVTYGLTPKAEIKYKVADGEKPVIEKVGIEELENYVTKLTEDSANNAEKIDEAIVYYPTSFCRNNVDLIDTPGLSDDERMNNITKSALTKVHAALMIIHPSYPFAQSEAEFLNYLIREGINKVIYVVSSIDKIDEDERDKSLGVITDRINQNIVEIARDKFPDDQKAQSNFIHQFGASRVLGVSGLLALRAKERGDEDLRRESNFDELEKLLENFLTEESGKVLLKSWIRKLEKIAEKIFAESEKQIAIFNSQINVINKNYQINVTLAETLRRILSQELDDLHTISKETLQSGPISGLDYYLKHNIVSALNKTIDNYEINANDLTFQHTITFHNKLYRTLEETGMETIKPVLQEVHQLASQNFDNLQARVAKTIISIDYISNHICLNQSLISNDGNSFMDRIFNCPNIPSIEIIESMTLLSGWQNFFAGARLPSGEFGWFARNGHINTFRADMKKSFDSQIGSLIATLNIQSKILELIQQTFGQMKSELENTKRYIESLQFEFRSNDERRKTFIEQKIAELRSVFFKVNVIKEEAKTYINF